MLPPTHLAEYELDDESDELLPPWRLLLIAFVIWALAWIAGRYF